jgi:hypothetical protein
MSGSQGQRSSRITLDGTLFNTTRVRRSGSRDFDIEVGQHYNKCQRPNQVGDESAISDRTLLRDVGATVVARRGTGLAALFKKTFSIHDPVVATIRGPSIDQLSFGAILAQAQQGGGTLSEAGSDVIDGVATDAVALVPADPAADAGLTREVVELSVVTHLPVCVLGFDETTLVREIDFSKVAVGSV